MKRYLLVGIALLFVSVNASLKEDFAQMDQEQDSMLSEMRKSMVLSSEETDDEDMNEDTITSNTFEEPENTIEEVSVIKDETTSIPSLIEDDKKVDPSVDTAKSELHSVVEESASDVRTDAIRKKAIAEVNEKHNAQKVSAEKIALEKALQLKVQFEEKEAEIKKVKEAQEKAEAEQREAEQREVEAYEKQRAEKLALEALQKAELEKKQLVQKVLEKEAIKQKSMEKISTTAVPGEEQTTTLDDVNISREIEEKTIAADSEYENAVIEMQKED